LKSVIRLIKKHAFFGASFGVAKATVYFVPLLLADVLSDYDYGVLEYALAGLGMVVNTLISLGVHGAYPYFILKEKDFSVTNGFKLHPIWLLVPFAINQIVYATGYLGIDFYLAFNVSFIIANQVFYSTQLKSHESIIKSVFIDSGIYIVLLVLYAMHLLNLTSIDVNSINYTVLIYALFYVVYGLYAYIKVEKTGITNQYLKILKFSVHLLISTFLIFLITTSGRILVEYIFDYESVGVYAFYFRLSAIVVMIHQIVNIAFFKKIYTFNPRILDKYYSLFFIGIFILSILVFLIAPYFVGHLSEFFRETYETNKVVYFLLSAQMVMWIASALNSNIIDRENLASKNNPRFLVLILIGFALIYYLKSSLDLALLTYIHFTIIFAAALIQYFSLSRKKIDFTKSLIVLCVIYLITTCAYFFLYK